MRRCSPVLLVAGAVVALLTSCSSGAGPTAADTMSTSPLPIATATTPTSVPATSLSPSDSGSPAPTPLDRTATPATTSGVLGPRSMPLATVLGPGWTSRVDPGNAEDGYTGNGTSVVARNTRDLAQALLPLGCADSSVYATPMPVPSHALEADYAYKKTGAHAVGLVLDYGDSAAAERFVRLYTTALRRCQASSSGSMAVTVDQSVGGSLFASVQVDRFAGETWRELVAPAGSIVRLIAVEGGRTPLRPWPEIAAALPTGP